jgi:hypothetical protein
MQHRWHECSPTTMIESLTWALSRSRASRFSATSSCKAYSMVASAWGAWKAYRKTGAAPQIHYDNWASQSLHQQPIQP